MVLWFFNSTIHDQINPAAGNLFGPGGSLLYRPSSVIVGYRPTIEMTLDQSTFKDLQTKFKSSGGMNVEFGPFSFGGSASGDKETWQTNFDETKLSITFESKSSQPMIIGLISDKTVSTEVSESNYLEINNFVLSLPKKVTNGRYRLEHSDENIIISLDKDTKLKKPITISNSAAPQPLADDMCMCCGVNMNCRNGCLCNCQTGQICQSDYAAESNFKTILKKAITCSGRKKKITHMHNCDGKCCSTNSDGTNGVKCDKKSQTYCGYCFQNTA